MILRRCLHTAYAKPISGPEFIQALQQSWTGIPSTIPDLGLAVSGGVDSMALAALCSQEIRSQSRIVAFVVNHAARPSSGEEADHVIDILKRQLRIDAHKLTLQWPRGTSPLELSHFETAARRLRFRALGSACAAMNIDNLLLGHHQDDQVETVLFRLSNGSAHHGLRGMAPSHNVPECEGLYGVHESNARGLDAITHSSRYRAQPWGPPIENGGVRLSRPLLQFSKQRLIATCKERGVQWVEDETNSDRALTARNAIRHIYKSFSLPRALSATALVQRSKHAGRERADIDVMSARMFTRSTIRLDTLTGVLTVTLPEAARLNADTLTDFQRRCFRMASVGYVRQLMMMVTSSDTVMFDQALVATRSLFLPPLWFRPRETEDGGAPDIVSCGSVLFQRLAGRTWRVTRQPPTAREVASSLIGISAPTDAEVPVLVDGRFWIKVQCDEIRAPLVIRLMRPHDVSDIRRHLGRTSPKLLKYVEDIWSGGPHPGILRSDLSKDKTRARVGIPVIALADDDHATKVNQLSRERNNGALPDIGPGAAVALPSLGITFDGLFTGEWQWLQHLRYDIRYKKVDLGSHDKTAVLRKVRLPE